MEEEKLELIEKYLEHKDAEKTARKSAEDTLVELTKFAPHKPGEIIKFLKSRYAYGNPIYQSKSIDEEEKIAVCTKVNARISDITKDVYYDYEFQPLKKDGTIAHKVIYPRHGYEWTDEYI